MIQPAVRGLPCLLTQQILNPRIWANCWEKMLCEIKLFVELEKGDGVASGYELFPVIHPIPHHHSSTLPLWTHDAQSLLHMRPWLLRGRLFDKVAGMSLQHVVDLTGREGGGSSVLAFQIWCGVVGKGPRSGMREELPRLRFKIWNGNSPLPINRRRSSEAFDIATEWGMCNRSRDYIQAWPLGSVQHPGLDRMWD